MAHWLAISNFDNWLIVKNNNVWGVAKRHLNTINKVKPGDKLLIYVSSRKIGNEIYPVVITAAYEIISNVFEDSTKIFTIPENMGDELFPFRINLKPIKIFHKPTEFKPLIPKLAFIKNKVIWNGHVRGKGIRQIPEIDYQLIMKSSR